MRDNAKAFTLLLRRCYLFCNFDTSFAHAGSIKLFSMLGLGSRALVQRRSVANDEWVLNQTSLSLLQR